MTRPFTKFQHQNQSFSTVVKGLIVVGRLTNLCLKILDRIVIYKCWFLWSEKDLTNKAREKPLRKDENQE